MLRIPMRGYEVANNMDTGRYALVTNPHEGL